MVQLSPHFSLNEFTFSETAARKGLNNLPNAAQIANLERTAAAMEQVRVLFGNVPIHISSGFRSVTINAAVGGSDTSAHCDGRAADFLVMGVYLIPAYNVISVSNIPFDQLIFEYGRWIHLGIAVNNTTPRKQTIMILSPGSGYEPFDEKKAAGVFPNANPPGASGAGT